MTPVVVRSGRHPHEVWIAFGLAALALYSLVFEPPSVSLDYALDRWQRVLWSTQVLFGAVVTLAGLAMDRRIALGLRVERIGCLLTALGIGTYITVLCNVSTFGRSGIVVTLACSVAAAALHRARQVSRDLRELEAAQQDVTDA